MSSRSASLSEYPARYEGFGPILIELFKEANELYWFVNAESKDIDSSLKTLVTIKQYKLFCDRFTNFSRAFLVKFSLLWYGLVLTQDEVQRLASSLLPIYFNDEIVQRYANCLSAYITRGSVGSNFLSESKVRYSRRCVQWLSVVLCTNPTNTIFEKEIKGLVSFHASSCLLKLKIIITTMQYRTLGPKQQSKNKVEIQSLWLQL